MSKTGTLEDESGIVVIFRDRRRMIWAYLGVVALGPVALRLSRVDNHSILRLRITREAVALSGIAMMVAGVWALVSLVRRRMIILSGTSRSLRLTAANRMLANPKEQTLTGDLRDLSMSVVGMDVTHLSGAERRGAERGRLATVTIRGSAGEIAFDVALGAVEDDYRERFDEWKRRVILGIRLKGGDGR